MSYYTEVAADSPIEFWKLDEASGTTAASAGSGNHSGTVAGGATVVTGKDGNARSFDGTDDYISAASVADFTAQTNYTAEAWFKLSTSDTASTDWRTIMRRDGSGAWLVRVAGSTSGIQQGAVQVYFQGLLISTGSTRFDDNAWHHVVVNKASSTYKLYVDGTNYTTSSGTAGGSIGTAGAFIIGNAGGSGGSERFKGSIDSVALYHTALSGARISAHYAAGGTTDYSFPATPMGASGDMPSALAQGNVRTVSITEDAYTDSTTPNTTYNSSISTVVGSTEAGYLKVPAPTLGSGEVVTSAILNLVRNGNYSSNVSVSAYRITSDWLETTVTYNSPPTSTFVKMVTLPTGSNSTGFTVDITDILAASNYGVKFSGGGAGRAFFSSEDSTSSNRPTVTYTIATQTDASHNAGVATASALMVDPTVEATDTVSASGQPFVASAAMPTPTVDTVRVIDLAAEHMDAYASMPSGGGFAVPVSPAATPLEASAETVDVTVVTERGVVVLAAPLAAVVSWVQPELVNDAPIISSEVDDPYFRRVTADQPKQWFRLADAGSYADDRVGGQDGIYHNVLVHRFQGPENRHSVYFDGTASIEQQEPEGTNIDESLQYSGWPRTTLEFSFRTNKSNSFLLASKDNATGSIGATTQYPAREMYLRNGKISYKTYKFSQPGVGFFPEPYEFTGFKNLADGQWHTVAIKGIAPKFGEEGVEIWVDGKLEVRRIQGNLDRAGGMLGFPDWIGSRPAVIDGVDIGALPSSLNFVGEMSEVSFYDHLLSDHSITRHYYDFMGWAPIEVQPVEAYADMTQGNGGRGNQKRALALTWHMGGGDMYAVGGDPFSNKMSFNPLIGSPGEFAGFKVFYQSVTRGPGPGLTYRDPVTDAPTLLNLKTDLNIDDYDVIFFEDWPDEGSETDGVASAYGVNAIETFVADLRWANNRGVGLFVTHPRLAVDLGIVDRVEFVPNMKEMAFVGGQGSAYGLYDYGSASKFPWNIGPSSGIGGDSNGSIYTGQPMNVDPDWLANKAYFYEDNNFNNRFRVRANIEYLTDIPSYMIEDAIYQVDYDGWGWQISAFKYLHRPDGLLIGDEYIFHGNNPGSMDWDTSDYDGYRIGRPKGTFATPLANVKAGTVVTTFGSQIWKEKGQVDNPYKDYATTIVLRPGDTLKGSPVGSKIYVNFSEQPSWMREQVPIQVLPAEGEPWPDFVPQDNAAQRLWEWSGTRQTLRSTSEQATNPFVNVQMPDGSVEVVRSGGTDANRLTMTRSANIFPFRNEMSWQMNRRGLWWLSKTVDIDPDAIVVAAEPLAAYAGMPQPVVVAQRDAVVNAEPSNALARMPKVAEDVSGDVEINELPMTAEATFTGFSRVISATPMTAAAGLVENFDAVHATGEQVVLTLYGLDRVVLTLKEEM